MSKTKLSDILFQHRKKSVKTLVKDMMDDVDHRVKKERQEKLEAITLEQRKKFMSNLKKGMSIGEALKDAGIDDLTAACDVLDSNIATHRFIDWEKEDGKTK